MKKFLSFILPLLILVSSCISRDSHRTGETPLYSLHLCYAKGFSVSYFKNFKEVTVFNPWTKETVYQRYYLVYDTSVAVPANGVKIKIPVYTLAATSVTHFEFLCLLNEIDAVTGVCSAKIIYNPQINDRLKKGLVVDLGDAFNMNLEKTVQLHADIVMVSGYNQNDPFTQRLVEIGIPVVYNNEWMENSLLGRTEWIKFIGAFFDKEKLADSIFQRIEQQYLEVSNKAKEVKYRPTIMSGSNFRGTWYMPGGQNFMAQLFLDAGGNYFYADDTTKGSLPLNFEKILKNFAETDVWLNCSYCSLDELLKADAKYALFRPVKLKQVYNFNKRRLSSGANDFWESGIAHPDLLLKDIISILHPELLPDYELFYTKKLE
ncbi:MAG TPA: ABC transporter substrate-binding protein [Paludibacteraceae bacterium]|nr:ABC transporter substrate-binding protein [Paludibacteraceae bacterium]